MSYWKIYSDEGDGVWVHDLESDRAAWLDAGNKLSLSEHIEDLSWIDEYAIDRPEHVRHGLPNADLRLMAYVDGNRIVINDWARDALSQVFARL